MSAPIKTETETTEKSYDLSKFCIDRILTNNTKSKTITILGKFPSQQNDKETEPAIVIFEKGAFTASNFHTENTQNFNDGDDDVKNGDIVKQIEHSTFFSSDTILKIEFLNDIYGNFECFPNPEINSKSIFFFTLTFPFHCIFVVVVLLLLLLSYAEFSP